MLRLLGAVFLSCWQGFVKQYREELTELDKKGHEMDQNYTKLLVRE